ncbi:MAG: YkgJ family cysteine cluster protein [Polyangiaceae bacterium]
MNRRDKEAKKKEKRAKSQVARKARPQAKSFMAELRSTIETTAKKSTIEILNEGRTPEKLGELVTNHVAYAEASSNAAMKAAPPPVPTACKAGCAFCCSLQVGSTPPEVLAMADHLRKTKSAAEVATILERLQAIETRTIGLAWQDRPPTPCALLDADNKCSAYEARPLSCRGWNSQDADPCKRFIEGDKTAETPVYEVPYATHQSVMDGTRRGLNELGLESRETDFSIGLNIALGNPDARDRWLKGEKVFERAYLNAPNRHLPVVE